MTEADIIKLIRKEVKGALSVPGRIHSIETIKSIARREAYSVVPLADKITTTDATPTEVKNIVVGDDEAGILKLIVIGLTDDGTEANCALQWVKYNKTAGTLVTLVMLDSGGSYDTTGANVEVVIDGSDNLSIEVTGAAATTIDWDCYTEILNKTPTGV